MFSHTISIIITHGVLKRFVSVSIKKEKIACVYFLRVVVAGDRPFRVGNFIATWILPIRIRNMNMTTAVRAATGTMTHIAMVTILVPGVISVRVGSPAVLVGAKFDDNTEYTTMIPFDGSLVSL